MSAFSRKVVPVSGGGEMPKSDCLARTRVVEANNSENSRSLPALPLASTTRWYSMADASATSGGRAHLGLQLMELCDATGRKVEQRIQLVSAKCVAFRRALN